jgi:hypothetical protein
MPIRPFHLMVTFWGAKYRDYFVDLCLPSLLAPRNLPLLKAEEGHKFFLATTDDDWAAIATLPITTRLRRHTEIRHVRIEQPQAGDYAANVRHEQMAFRMLLEAAYNRAALGCLLSPDVLAPDGTIEALLSRARDGWQLVLCPSLRQIEDKVIFELGELGIIPAGGRLSHTAREIVIPKRTAARLLVQHLHPNLSRFEEGAKDQPPNPPFRYWRSQDGLILHSFFGTPVLIDFSCVPDNHTACLDNEHMFESTYLPRNFAGCKKIYVVRDSDEFALLSLTGAEPGQQAKPVPGYFRSICNIRQSHLIYTNDGKDPVRSAVSHGVTCWHGENKSLRLRRLERKVIRLLQESIGDYWRGEPSRRRRLLYEIVPQIQLAEVIGCLGHPLTLRQRAKLAQFTRLGNLVRHAYLAAIGNADSQRWLNWTLRKYKARLTGRSFDEPHSTDHGPQP